MTYSYMQISEGWLVESTIAQIEPGHFLPHSGIRFPMNGCTSCPIWACVSEIKGSLIRSLSAIQEPATLIGLTGLNNGQPIVAPKLNYRRPCSFWVESTKSGPGNERLSRSETRTSST